MRLTTIFLLGLLVWFSSATPSQARFVGLYLPDDLDPKAEIICTGKVLSVGPASIFGVLSRDLVMEGRVKVLHVC